MLKSPLNILVAIIVLVVIGALVLNSSREATDVDVEALVRQKTQRQTEMQLQAMSQKIDEAEIEQLAEEGRGQSLPTNLVAWPMSEDNYWFVGREKHDVGVEIPFEPGHLPQRPANLPPVNDNPGFLGADACKSCHESIYESFVETAHYRTTRLASPGNIAGSFSERENLLRTRSSNVSFEMVRRGDRSYQRTHFFDWMFEVPFDLTFGSNVLGESYAYWHGDKLYQMHVSYLTESNEWANSPGFNDGDAVFRRVIRSACLDCHATYVDVREDGSNFTPQTLILGVSCERCHGPGKEHVDYHQSNPNDVQPRAITVPSDLTRQQQMDVCGQCHTGVKELLNDAAFQFRPGDKLDDHYLSPDSGESAANSVHTSNQSERLSRSKCYQSSTAMACVDCHNPHQFERGQLNLFSKRCLKCHEPDHCGMSETIGAKIESNCIDCHMPRRATSNMTIDTSQGTVFPPLRDHFIRIDRQASDEFMKETNR